MARRLLCAASVALLSAAAGCADGSSYDDSLGEAFQLLPAAVPPTQTYDSSPAKPPQASDPFPNADSFYEPPSALLGAPGDVIRSRATTLTLDPFFYTAEDAVDSRQILYQSTDALGRAIAVSGTVLIPKAAWRGTGPRPLVTYAVGTRGLGDRCAPSYTLSHGDDYEGPLVSSMLDKGWAVAVTDYQGLGTPGTHTYMVGPAEGHAVLDMARAAQRLLHSGLAADGPVAITGYSQGGSSGGWAAQLAATYAPELNLKGTAIGGVPGDLYATAEFLDGSPFVAFALLASLGLDAAYPELDLASYLNDRGRELIAQTADMCIASVDDFVTGVLGTSLTTFADYCSENPLQSPAWQARLFEVQLGAVAPSAPVFQYHAEFDQIVPFDQAAALRLTWCHMGVDLQWEVMSATDHALGVAIGPPYAIAWIEDRFAGKPTQPNCDR